MRYGYTDGNKGLEADYWVNDNILYVKIYGANHWYDYLQCFLAWPRTKVGDYRVHRKWYQMALALADELPLNGEDLESVIIAGHSMGGAVASLLPLVISTYNPGLDCAVKVVNAPKSGYHNYHTRSFYDKGDIVGFLPLAYQPYLFTQQYANTRPFWKAHNNMPDWWGEFKELEL